MTAPTSYIDALMARCPPGTVRVVGDCPRPRRARMNGVDTTHERSIEGEATPGIGHNSGAQPTPEDDEARGIEGKKAYYIGVLTDWFANRREKLSEHMTPEEIGACESRPAVLLQAMAIGIASIFREALFNPQDSESADERARGAFAMMGVYVVDVYFSHNDRGCSTASAERVAELLGCSKNSVKRARARLVQHQILAGGRKDGYGDRWWPVISRKLAGDPKASVVWLLDATSEPIKRGRPAEIWPPDAGPRLDGEIWTPDAGPRFPEPGKSRPPLQKSRPPDPKSRPRMRGRETLDIRQDNLSGADAPGASATEDLFSEGTPPDSGASPERVPTSEKDAPCKPSSAEHKGKRAPKPKATEEQFTRFWAAYPIREGKAAARKNFLALSYDEAELAVVGAAGYAAKIAAERARRGEEPRIKWAQGWLTERRFEDYTPAHTAAPAGPSLPPCWWRDDPSFAASLELADWKLLYDTHAKNGTWPIDMMGPAPGAPGCLLPRDVIAKLKRGS
jgi:hypothetical protein